MPSKDLKVTLIGEDNTGRAFGSAGKNADGLGHKFASLGKGIGLAFGGVAIAGIAGVGTALAQGFKDAASYEKITNQVAQTIKSTGAAAGVSAEGLKKYAGQLESMSGVDEELILSGQNVLLTFTNIRNGVGKGNDIFDQASEAALNLSTTMGGDLVGANTLVGKALNDPIRGMTALRRAGVQLTEAQQEQIKTMVESGDTMGAQKVLLGELETQFGGAAKAAGQGLTGSIARAKDAFQDMFRGIATALLPKLTELMQFFADKLMPGIKGIYDLVIGGDFTGALRDAFGWEEDSGIVTFLFGVRDAFIAVKGVIGSVVEAFRGGGDQASGSMGKMQEAVRALVDFVGPAFEQLKSIFTNVVIIVKALWNAFGDDLVSYFSGSFQTMLSTLSGVLSVIKGVLDVFVGVFSGDWSQAWEGVKAIFSGVWNVIVGVFKTFNNIMNSIASVLMQAIGAIFAAGWNGIKALTSAAWNAITGAVSGAWNAIRNAVANGISNVVGFVRGLPGQILGALGDLGSLLLNAGRSVVQGFINGIKGAFTKVKETLGNLTSLLPDWKGPASRDAMILHDAGRLVIGGFEAGLISKFGDVRRTLGDLTAMAEAEALGGIGGLGIRSSAAGMSGFGGGGTPAMSGAVAARSNAPMVHIDNYNEARQSPQQVAQDLTFLARTGG